MQVVKVGQKFNVVDHLGRVAFYGCDSEWEANNLIENYKNW